MQLHKDTLFANRFRLVECKGRGSFGEVWLAHDEQLENMEVAIKVYIALDDRGVADFKSEYRNTFGLSHPNLLHAYQFDLCDNRPYLVMPYCPDSAASLVGRVDEITLWHFIRDVASGLAYLHDLYIVHHDIKPDNVLIDGHGNFLITDFGISTRLRTTLQRNSTHEVTGPKGSLPYMAPELFDLSAGAVLASDIWALGATLYEMASGELPFFGQGGAMLRNGATISRPNLPYSNDLIDTILECIKKEPWERPKAIDLADRAQNVIDGHPYEGSPEVLKESPEPLVDTETSDTERLSNDIDRRLPGPKPKKTWLWVLLVVLLGGGGFALWKLSTGRSESEKHHLQADYEMFLHCRTGDDYRAYMKAYPEGVGVNYELAKFRLEEWIRDSINQAENSLTRVEPEQQKPETPNDKDKKKNEKKEMRTEEKLPSPKQKQPSDGEWKDRGEELTRDNKQLSSGNDKLTLSNNPNTTKPNQHSGLTKAPDESDHESDQPSLKPGVGLIQTQPTSPNSEEGAYQRATAPNATLEDCIYWMEMYGDARTRDKQKWNHVKTIFYQLYTQKLKDCRTAQDYKIFINEHDGIMRRARLAGTEWDRRMRSNAEDKKKELEKKS